MPKKKQNIFAKPLKKQNSYNYNNEKITLNYGMKPWEIKFYNPHCSHQLDIKIGTIYPEQVESYLKLFYGKNKKLGLIYLKIAKAKIFWLVIWKGVSYYGVLTDVYSDEI